MRGSSPGEEDGVTKTVMDVMDELVESVRKRKDKNKWMVGRGFVGILEYWVDFAKRVGSNSCYYSSFLKHFELQVGDMSTLNKILALMQDAGPTSSSASRTLSESSEHPAPDTLPEIELQPKEGKDASFLEDAQVFAILTQTTVVLGNYAETPTDELKARIEVATATLDRSRLVFEETEGSKDKVRVKGKLGRALERLRRAGVKVVEAGGKGGLRNMPALKAMLEGVIDVLAEVEFYVICMDRRLTNFLFIANKCGQDIIGT